MGDMTCNPDRADKRGYLKEPFRLFQLKDRDSGAFAYHYHEFHKLILFLSGEVTYRVEGRGYTLKGGDLLLIPAHAIHQPIIGGGTPYARAILWIQPEALEDQGLEACFDRCRRQNAYLLDRGRYDQEKLTGLLRELERETGGDFGAQVLSQALFTQLMVWVNRWVLRAEPELRERAPRSDPKIDEILAYINQNLTADLSIDGLCRRFYLSRSWLMHRFKSVTGCPLHQYVLQKRLILAAQLLRAGAPVGEAARRSGFRDYSTFLRCFRKAYGVAPRDFGGHPASGPEEPLLP